MMRCTKSRQLGLKHIHMWTAGRLAPVACVPSVLYVPFVTCVSSVICVPSVIGVPADGQQQTQYQLCNSDHAKIIT